MADTPTDVQDNTTARRFVIEDDGAQAELLDRKRPDRLILIHTDVPHALAGRGLGGRLIRAAIASTRAEHLTVMPWCPFVERQLVWTVHSRLRPGHSVVAPPLRSGRAVTTKGVAWASESVSSWRWVADRRCSRGGAMR